MPNPFLSNPRSAASRAPALRNGKLPADFHFCAPKSAPAAERFGALRQGHVPAPATRSLQREVQNSWDENLDPRHAYAAIELHLAVTRGSEQPVTWKQGKLRDEQGDLPARQSKLVIGGNRWQKGHTPEVNPYNNQPQLMLGQARRWNHGQAPSSSPYNNRPHALFGGHRPAPQPAADMFGLQAPSADTSPAQDFGLAPSAYGENSGFEGVYSDNRVQPSEAYGPSGAYGPCSGNESPSGSYGPSESAAPPNMPVPYSGSSEDSPETFDVNGMGGYATNEAIVQKVHSYGDQPSEDPQEEARPQRTVLTGSLKSYKYPGVHSHVSRNENDASWGSTSVYGVYMKAFANATTPPEVTRVRYLDKHEKPDYRVTLQDGIMFYRDQLMDTSDATIIDHRKVEKKVTHTGLFGLHEVKTEVSFERKSADEVECSKRYIWVMTRNGRIYAADWGKEYTKNGWAPNQKNVEGFHHSSFAHNKDVAAAGEILVQNGRLRWVSNASGHYMPGPGTLVYLLNELVEQGVDLSDVFVQLAVGRFGAGACYRAEDFHAARGDESKLTPMNM